MNNLKMIYVHLFKVISIEQALEYNLNFVRNVHGDEINHINCRSIWADKNGRTYRVKSIFKIADKYQEFFKFFSQKYNLILTITEMNDILLEARKLDSKLLTFKSE